MEGLTERPALIGVDWGTSSLRLVAMRSGGEIIDSLSNNDGILGIENAAFAAHLDDVLTPWRLDTQVPIIASGMITSRQGWLETPYVACPAPASALADNLATRSTPRGRTVHFITGLCCERPSASGGATVPDVMRGEETQVLGLGVDNGLLVMPGTHSKWVQVTDGAVQAFATHMTGEVFAVLTQATILGRLITPGDGDSEAFARGVRHALHSGDGLLADIFSARTLALFERLAGAAVRDYLSGLLIGAEFRAGLGDTGASHITLLGDGDLVARYEEAAKLAGVTAVRAPQHIAAVGQWRIARAADLIT